MRQTVVPYVTLCVSCNAPAPEFEDYQGLAHELLTVMAEGVTILRLSQESPKETPRGLTDWKVRANAAIHLGNDYREALNAKPTIHNDCSAWKIMSRRVNSLLRDLHFELTMIRGLR